MKIYSMTATFGKLEHETLTLKPGLNVLEAPNEWGKSTWSAFLVAMLYGIDTRERTKQDYLADKERYAPWSGSPMSGRMDLEWNGRDITIERATKGRSIFGQFRAYETQTGLEVAELTAANCGEQLLGVEKSVFLRSGFLRLTDLPVSQDESLRRRLNALVTTGDESGASDALAQKLKELKNHCKSNRANGLIPKAEAQKAELEGKLQQISQLREQYQRIQTRQEELSAFAEKLENHRAVLEYQAAQEKTQKAQAAQLHLQSVAARTAELEQACGALPPTEALMQKLTRLQQLREQKESLQMDAQMGPGEPDMPEVPAPFRGCSPEQAVKQAQEDTAQYQALRDGVKKPSPVLWICGLAVMLLGIVLLGLQMTAVGMGVMAVGLAALVIGIVLQNSIKHKNLELRDRAERLLERYRPLRVSEWVTAAERYGAEKQAYDETLEQYRAGLARLREQMEEVNSSLMALTGGTSYVQCEQQWKSALEKHKELADAIRELRRTEEMVKAFGAEEKQAVMPDVPDAMTYTQAETLRLLSDVDVERHQLQRRLGHYQGQMEALGAEAPLYQQLEAVNGRLARLEDTYAALEIAQQTLSAASAELQRRFAPRISRRAQELFGKLTGSRYDRLTLGEDLSLSVGAQGEDTLHTSLWRSDGTVDQLYLALRLAVSEELTPEAPLILDDALVRFDDQRLASAIDILKECARNKQVILFTCQGREAALL